MIVDKSESNFQCLSRAYTTLQRTLLFNNKLKGLAQKRIKAFGALFLFEDDIVEVRSSLTPTREWSCCTALLARQGVALG